MNTPTPIPPLLMSRLMDAFGREWTMPLDGLPDDVPLGESIAYRRGIKAIMDWLNESYATTHGSPYYVFFQRTQPSGNHAAQYASSPTPGTASSASATTHSGAGKSGGNNSK